MTAWNNDAMRSTAALGKMHEHLTTAPTEPAPEPAPYRTCPACGEAYATFSDWLACDLPASGRDLQDDGAGGLLRLRLCRGEGCGSSMATQVADVAALAIAAQDEARIMAASYAGAVERVDTLTAALSSAAAGWHACGECLRPATVRTRYGGALKCDRHAKDLEVMDLPQAEAVRVAMGVRS